MTNLRKVIILFAAVAVMAVLFMGIKIFDSKDDSYIKVYKEYKEKGKSYKFEVDDVRKGFE